MINIDKNKELSGYLQSILREEYENYLNSPAESTALRINKLKSDSAQLTRFLESHHIKYKTIDFNPDGIILENDALPLSHTLPFFTGWFQYQGISSQLPVILLDPQPGDTVLDIAAAPGSKAAQIADMMQNKGMLVLNDNSYQRLQALNTNMQRGGALNTCTLNLRGERLGKILPEFFDKILVDAPCTALGTLASNREVCGWWSRDKLAKLTAIQYYLLVSALKALKVGGTLVYSTCSIAPEENEVLVNTILRQYPVGIVGPEPQLAAGFDRGLIVYNGETLDENLISAMRIWPHKHKLEGFFAVKLRKLDRIQDDVQAVSCDSGILRPSRDPEMAAILENISDLWGIPADIWPDYNFYTTKDRIWMVVDSVVGIPADKFVSAGILLAEKRLSGWKLVNGSVQLLAKYISRRRVSLPDKDLKKIFRDGKISGIGLEDGYYVLDYTRKSIASVYVEKDVMRIRIPHKFNLVL